MCEECGCGEAAHKDHDHSREGHTHSHGQTHTHTHDGHTHTHTHDGHAHRHEELGRSRDGHDQADEAAGGGSRVVRVESRVLARNDELAASNRAWLAERGIVALNLISSPGTGKTLLLERTLEQLSGEISCAVIAGDQQTDRDAQRLARSGVPVRQIETQNACHLDAERVAAVLPEVAGEGTRLLFIENVGNLVCPAAFDLGEHFKVALLSTTEGEDKPIKYPALFSDAGAVVLTKMDLAPHLEWDAGECRRFIQQVRPGAFIFELSARTGQGMDLWCEYLRKLVA